MTAVFWLQLSISGENTTMTWKRAFWVYAIVLLMTHAATVGAWVLVPQAWVTFAGLTAITLQSLTLWAGLIHTLDSVRNTDGIFQHALRWTIVQPLSHLHSAWRTLHLQSEQAVRPFPGEGRRLREVESELV